MVITVDLIQFKHVSFAYAHSQQILSDLSFVVPAGSRLSIIGPNGSGKSTLVKLMAGLLTPTKGQVLLNGTSLAKHANLQTAVGIVFQNPENQFVGSTVAEDVAFSLENLRVPTQQMDQLIDQALRRVDMLAYRHASIERLSGGQKQRVAIAGILALQPQLIIFDEATSMLDPVGRRQIMQIMTDLQSQGLTTVSITHHLDEAELSDNILVLDRGHLVDFGPVHQVLADQSLMKQLALLPAPGTELKAALAEHDISVPDNYQTTEEVVSWLKQQLHSNR